MTSLRIPIRVKPGSSRTKVGGTWGEDPVRLVVAVQAPAVDGRANAAVVTALAKAFGVPKRDLEIVLGMGSRSKIVAVSDPPVGLVTHIQEVLHR